MSNVLFTAIVKKGKASYFLDQSRRAGATGGTIIHAFGTITDPILDLLGLSDSKRELLLMLVESQDEDQVHHILENKCQLSRKGHGVLISCPTSSVYGSHHLNQPFNKEEFPLHSYQLVVTIVDRDLGDEVVKRARQEGAQGATIIHGRGLGSEKASQIFNITIEPEKELVLMIVESAKVADIIEKLSSALEIDQPGKGIIFSVAVNNATGLFQQIEVDE